MKRDLSILIPARNEQFLNKTVENILENIEGNTEILIGLDGEWADPPIKDNSRVTILHVSDSIGQRAITNQLCRLSQAKYVMKIDAHCAVDKGFDVKMLKDMQEDWVMIPTMYNLHAFDWVCKCGKREYQGRSHPCPNCGGKMEKEIIWKEKRNPESTSFRLDTSLHFQYWREYKKHQTGQLVESMTIQGSCFMVSRDKYWDLDICSEKFNSWGQQGAEVALKYWLSGGRVIVNKNTWYAHMFRTQGGDFGFPYNNPESKIEENRKLSRELFINNKWEKAIHPFSWLISKFNPPEWNVSKGILYYTDNKLNMKIAHKCRKHIAKVGLPITSVSLKPLNFGKNIHLDLKRSNLTMFKQILAGLEAMKEDIVFLCEHDVLYNPSHFDFIPPQKDVFYYNKNVWRLRLTDGHYVYYDHKATHALCAYRETLIKEYKERVRRVEEEGFNKNGYEPGTRSIRRGGFSDSKSEYYSSKDPIVDIRHDNNLSASKWNQNEFKNQKSCTNWKDADEIPYWGKVKI